MRLGTAMILALVSPLAFAGCDSDPVATESEGWFQASIQGAAPLTYEGTGVFSVGGDAPGSMRPWFTLASRGVGRSVGQGFQLLARGGERLPEGRYLVGRMHLTDSASDSVFAQYTRRDGSTERGYRGVRGELEITTSTDERIEGRFRFEAVLARVCTREMSARSMTVVRCTFDPAPGVDPELIEVAGSFEAVRGRGRVW